MTGGLFGGSVTSRRATLVADALSESDRQAVESTLRLRLVPAFEKLRLN